MNERGHQIGDWVLDHTTQRLSREGREHRLPRLQYDLLCVLLQHAGRLVPREALIERAWQRRVVSDEVLSRQIASLRLALEDDAREPRYIETVPKAGYRLLAEVIELPDPAARDTVTATPDPAPEPHATRRIASMRHWIVAGVVGLALIAVAISAIKSLRRPAPSVGWTPEALSREQSLVSDPAIESVPRLSRDGRWLTYASRAQGAARSTVRLARADGGGARDLFEAEGVVTGLAFSPDATMLALVEVGADGCRIRRWRLPDGPLHTLHACGPGRGLDWSTDGAWIAFTAPTAGTDSAYGLIALPTAGGDAVSLTLPSVKGVVDAEPRWSSDGQRLAFARGVPGEQQVFVSAHDGSGAARLGIDDRNRITALAWAGDGRQLLVAMDANGSPALFALDPISGARQWLGARGIASFDLAAGVGLVHEIRRYDANIWWHPLDGVGAPRRLTPSARFDAQPALSPQADRVAYASTRAGVGTIWIADAQGREAQVALPGDGIWTRPSWSPDAKRLLLTHYVDGVPRAVVHDLDSGATETLAPLDVTAATFAADGSIVAIVREAGTSHLAHWREGEPVRRVDGTAGVIEFRLGERLLAWVSAESSAIRVALLDDPSAVRTMSPEPLDAGAWGFAGSTLAVLSRDSASGQAVLWRVDPSTGAGQLIAALPRPDTEGPAVVVAPDWRFALVVRIDGLEADLWRVPQPGP